MRGPRCRVCGVGKARRGCLSYQKIITYNGKGNAKMAANWGWARQLRQDVDDRLIGGPHVVIDLPRLVQSFKGGSSYAASRLPGNVLGLRWAPEYSATTVGPKQLADVIRYIEGQAKRHPGEAVEDGHVPRVFPR